ncbi:transcription factor bHLH148-like [Silene latifolia]|uniref:transcription factor bHLH148-like n=1 Tax=Silene latifolia TaxID=37657 RepID=UPI003D77A431
MEPSRTPPNPEPSTSSPSSSTREIRLRKTHTTTQSSTNNSIWKSEKTQQIFSSKLLSALRQVDVTPRSPSAPRRSRAVREAADKALAVAAKGRTRWSQAILTNKIKVKYLNQKHKRQKVSITGPNRLPSVSNTSATRILSLKGKGKEELPGVERKVKTLGRLVPGCRKETLPVILEEATDYIPALEMQIRAMRDLLSRLSAVSNSAGNGDGVSGGSSSSPPPPNNETVL